MEHHLVPLAAQEERSTGLSRTSRLRHLAAAGSRIPVIMLTAHGDNETRWRCLEAAATAFLEKPVRTPALLDAVRRALAPT
jgi:FixJ family two-component response regulator